MESTTDEEGQEEYDEGEDTEEDEEDEDEETEEETEEEMETEEETETDEETQEETEEEREEETEEDEEVQEEEDNKQDDGFHLYLSERSGEDWTDSHFLDKRTDFLKKIWKKSKWHCVEKEKGRLTFKKNCKKITKIVKKNSHSYAMSAWNRIIIDRQALATRARDVLAVKPLRYSHSYLM